MTLLLRMHFSNRLVAIVPELIRRHPESTRAPPSANGAVARNDSRAPHSTASPEPTRLDYVGVSYINRNLAHPFRGLDHPRAADSQAVECSPDAVLDPLKGHGQRADSGRSPSNERTCAISLPSWISAPSIRLGEVRICHRPEAPDENK